MSKEVTSIWGEWITRRARFLGFRTNKGLAAQIGCTTQHLRLWSLRQTPPYQMRSGFDLRISHVLKTDPKTLFTDYANLSPESAPIIEPCDAPTNETPLRAEIAAAAETLSGPSLRALSATARALLSTAAA